MNRRRHRAARVTVVALAVAVSSALSPALRVRLLRSTTSGPRSSSSPTSSSGWRRSPTSWPRTTSRPSTRRSSSTPRSPPPRRRSPASRPRSTRCAASCRRSPCRRFMGAGTNGLGPMFTDSTAFTDDLQRDQLARVALSAGTATTDELDQAVTDLEDERAELDEAAAQPPTRPSRSSWPSRRPRAEGRVRRSPRRGRGRARPADAGGGGAARAASPTCGCSRRAEEAAAAPARPAAAAGPGADASSAPAVAATSAVAAATSAGVGQRRGRAAARRSRPPSSRAGTAVNAAMSQIGVAVPVRLGRSPAWRSTARASRRGRGRRPACRSRTSRAPSTAPSPTCPRKRRSRATCVLLLADQPREHLPRWRPARPRPQQRHHGRPWPASTGATSSASADPAESHEPHYRGAGARRS